MFWKIMTKLWKTIPLVLGSFLIISGVYLNQKEKEIVQPVVKEVSAPKEEIPKEEPPKEEPPEPIPYTGVEYIALAGIDRSSQNDADNSDCMILVQLDHDNQTIKMYSIYRDTYLKVDQFEYFKANSAYNRGGPEGFLSMLNQNLDLNVAKYVTVDFQAMQQVVDAVGGIDLTVSAAEASEINRYNGHTAEVCNVPYQTIPETEGTYHLNGSQTVSFCRIRMIDDDFARTNRQRVVLSVLLEKIRSVSPLDLLKAVNGVTPYVQTNVENPLNYALIVKNYQIVHMDGFPFEKTCAYVGRADCVIPINFEANVRRLHEELGDIGYQPSQNVMDVQNHLHEMGF